MRWESSQTFSQQTDVDGFPKILLKDYQETVYSGRKLLVLQRNYLRELFSGVALFSDQLLVNPFHQLFLYYYLRSADPFKDSG